MANCKHCGKWVGAAGDAHIECAELHDQGLTDAEITAQVGGRTPTVSGPKPVTIGTIAIGVFLGQILFAALGAVLFAIYSILTEINH